jgi:alpha-mannosidase
VNCLPSYTRFLARILLALVAVAWTATAFSAEPARKWVVYVLPHSHVDIGYTHLQPEVEKLQIRNINAALDLCRQTADYPPEAQFKWNVEVLWAVDSYLKQATPEKQQQFVEAVRKGQIGLDALYGNELTGLCRPEELLRLCDLAQQLAKRCNVKIDSAMISDVPGLTWGTASVFGQAGVKYISLGINFIDGGRSLLTWEDKPFYWLGPDGRHKVLCWAPYRGYALGSCQPWSDHNWEKHLPAHLAHLESKGYPYDIVQLRWSVNGDNGTPDLKLPDAVKNWNAKHPSVKMVIATTSQMFHEFEKRYADKIPVVSGDFTPYWENGACSSARETALNRTAAERLVQAETLWALLNPAAYPAAQFTEAWRNVILYDEHTWGAYNSIDEPDKPFVKDQWKIKQAFALDGDAQSHKLLDSALDNRNGEPLSNAVDVFNTSSWPRTDLVVLGKDQSAAGDLVTGSDGKAVPSQRLSTGELAFLAQNVPALAACRYTIGPGKAVAEGKAKAEANTVASPAISAEIDPASGTIVSLKGASSSEQLCDMKSGVGLNRYYYVPQHRVNEAKQATAAKITVKEPGPLVASLLIESDAPGCAKLTREIRVVDGLDRVDIVNVLDKKTVRKKEGVHLGFAFNVPDGLMRLDIPWAVMRPEIDQIPGSCKNFLCVGRWADVSNAVYGVTWATLDAPMVEVGAITGDIYLPRHDPHGNDWMAKLEPSQTLYSMVMNNHWFTNYKADQDGPTTFRYALRPHGSYDAGAAQRFGIECSQPLVAAAARGPAPAAKSLITIEPTGVILTSLQPVEGGKRAVARLFNATGKAAKATIHVNEAAATSGSSAKTFDMAPWEIVTLPVPIAR